MQITIRDLTGGSAAMTWVLCFLCFAVISYRLYLRLPEFILALRGKLEYDTIQEVYSQTRDMDVSRLFLVRYETLIGWWVGMIGVLIHTLIASLIVLNLWDAWPYQIALTARILQNIGFAYSIRALTRYYLGEAPWIFSVCIGLVAWVSVTMYASYLPG